MKLVIVDEKWSKRLERLQFKYKIIYKMIQFNKLHNLKTLPLIKRLEKTKLSIYEATINTAIENEIIADTNKLKASLDFTHYGELFSEVGRDPVELDDYSVSVILDIREKVSEMKSN